jgi:hypothetical protein
MLTVGAISYATLYYSNQAFVVPTNVKVHTYKYQNNTLMVSKTYAPGQTIPAGTAVVVAAQPGSYPFLYSSETGDGDAANMLRGFDEAATATAPEGNASDYYFYMLSLNKDSDPGSAGFYFGSGCTNGEPFTSGAHKAYLALPKSQANQARSFLLNAIPTGINKLTTSPQQRGSSCVYNVAGQRVGSNYHGIVIVNGKKRVVRLRTSIRHRAARCMSSACHTSWRVAESVPIRKKVTVNRRHEEQTVWWSLRKRERRHTAYGTTK